MKVYAISRGADKPNGATFTWSGRTDQCCAARGACAAPHYQAAC